MTDLDQYEKYNKKITKKECKYCHEQIPIKATVCPYCRKKQQNYAGAIALVIVILIVFSSARKGNSHKDANNYHSDLVTESISYGTIEEEPEIEEEKVESTNYIKITATEMIEIYEGNEVECQQKFDKIPLEITGTIESINVGAWGDSYIVLRNDKNEWSFDNVWCYAKDEEVMQQFTQLKKDDKITIRGIGFVNSMTFGTRESIIVN